MIISAVRQVNIVMEGPGTRWAAINALFGFMPFAIKAWFAAASVEHISSISSSDTVLVKVARTCLHNFERYLIWL